ncbi:peritrophin-44-like [Episyrphus balteatus]|uniref:peritrophin-44-like n=1 Tax=Episyrphus balteatus TaxID=286459 RepID=UPI0024862A9A|nr:peritrophin-44-like [Episyrphus balteatus]
MKGSSIYFVAASLFLIVLGLPTETEAIYNNFCRLFPDGTKFASPKSCDSYVTCTNSTEVTTKCSKNQIFSVESKKCVTSKTGCPDPCAPDIDNYWVADPKSCSGYYYCQNGTGLLGNCALGQHFNELDQECIYSEKSKCKGDSYCQIVPNGIMFKDEKNCEKYQICEKSKLKSKSCPKGQWFDRDTGKCAAKATVKSCNSLPQKVCVSGWKTEKNKAVKDKATCRGYYWCADKGKQADENPEWHQCKEGEFFNYKKQSCMHPLNVDCEEDRCDGRGNLFVNSDTSCQHYLVCKDGMTVAERKCADEMFYDEKRQACTTEVIEYDICT